MFVESQKEILSLQKLTVIEDSRKGIHRNSE